MKFWIALLALAGLTTPAVAAWREAASEHFVIYADTSERDVREFAETLERFHAAMELRTGRKIDSPSPSNRVTIYVVGSETRLKELYGNRNSAVAGFYVPRAGASVAFTPYIRLWDRDSFSTQILLHEYAHHFLISTSRHAMPRWLSEGAAEYFSSAEFGRDGSVTIGMPNNNRAYELANAREVPLMALLDRATYAERRGNRYDAFYGRSWLLFHYLTYSPERAGQLSRYWAAVAEGHGSLAAANAVFGDLDQLESELRSYNRQRRMAATRYASEDIVISNVTVRRLSEGMDAMMPVIMRSRRGVGEEDAPDILSDAREIASRYSDDAEVLAALAEAKHDAGLHDAAIVTADQAISLDPARTNAYVQKIYALFAKAEDADDAAPFYTVALEPIMALNRIENDHPIPLIYLYRSEIERGLAPSENAQAALERASQLAPFDHGLTVTLASMFASQGYPRLAADILGPVAANPHGGSRARLASQLIDHLVTAKEGQSVKIDINEMVDSDEEEEIRS
ncbi:hypothetical protein [Erythrobacter sp. SD-21]|uniref:hypothetical protein n=1 Tax=Erythrobacter sp. SD-21 TaxID=161528 RepID=UPI000153FE50|nr:hypothetical protein [Erythrobacter sp. SD-21]EDL48885.1 hypothetical protein ED21_24181 [Erythrobacter sp. SD-21]